MAELTTLARPYARAAFESARADSQLNEWAQALVVAAAVASEPKVKQLLAAPGLTAAQKSAAFADVCGSELSDKFKNFVSVLAENKRLALLPFIQTLFIDLKSQLEKAINVEVTTAFEISAETQSQLVIALTKKLDRVVTLESSIDKSLIGGAVIRAGDTVIDGSVKGRLAKLAEAMNS
ncbi:F0F1 ATP synthase subunit delta [Marinagarivorans cellulosilyticus]|uniref:ATP synthase subunit delta n=1 Tax=Marinagarivorans cellulosilyticus TaxID=2721545 RepID=A0AAN1WLQ1_9GAMM|nr:F0F1 ATP synthase subunit delta [Marinagarivorans cellulosilyticus]BCD99910.1 F-type H+-transporting ATPase subunit delta [Marinagarivorans cellulosilyticus]